MATLKLRLFCALSLLLISTLAWSDNDSNCDLNYQVENAHSHYGEFALYLPSLGNGLWCSYYYKFSKASFEEKADGTAILNGQLINICDPRKSFEITMDFSGRSDEAPAGSPYHPPHGVDLEAWHYYSRFSGQLTGGGFYDNVKVELTKDGPAFQIGEGASSSFDNTITNSGAGWLNWHISQSPRHLNFHRWSGRGDIIVRLNEKEKSCVSESKLDISKHIEGPDSRTLETHESAEFNFSVTNTSNEDLFNIVINDPLAPECNDLLNVLRAGDTHNYTCTLDNIGDYEGLGTHSNTNTSEQVFGDWADLFDSKAYDNNDGSDNFSTKWKEKDDWGYGPYGGLVRVNHHGYLQMSNSWWSYNNSKVQRAFDLSDMNSAKLTLKWKTWYGVDPKDKVLVQISSDGQRFETIKRLKGRKLSLQNTEIDISEFISANTQVRFELIGYYGYKEIFFLDSIAIESEGAIEFEEPNTTPENAFVNTACVYGINLLGTQYEDCDTSTIIIEQSQREEICLREVTDSYPAGGNAYGFWLNQYQGEAQANWFYNVSSSSLIEYDDGTARLQGDIVSHSGQYQYSIDIHLAGKTSDRPVGSPYLPFEKLDTDNWYYYTELNGTVGPYSVSRRGPSLQIGIGANLNDLNMGASSWFNYGEGDEAYGDLNIGFSDCLD